MNKLYFDMDGTIYPLYEIDGWLNRLRENDMSVFLEDVKRAHLGKIRKAVRQLMEQGWEVGIITWAPMDVPEGSTTFYSCKIAKQIWAERYFPELVDHFYCLPYGESKASVVDLNAEDNFVLVDDNKVVRKDWRSVGQNFHTINASRAYVKALEGLLG